MQTIRTAISDDRVTADRVLAVLPDDRMTVDEFFDVAPEDRKAELIDGVLIVPSPATTPHERLQVFLLTTLHIFVHQRNLGEVLGSRTALRMGVPYHAYEPDILFVSRERADIVQKDGIHGVPDLVVEVLSQSTRTLDEGIKRHTYASAGVRELWLIDPEGEDQSHFYQRRHPEGALAETQMQQGVLESLVIPGFMLRAEWLWPSSGRLPDELSVLRSLGVL